MGLSFGRSDKVFGLDVKSAREVMKRMRNITAGCWDGPETLDQHDITHAIGKALFPHDTHDYHMPYHRYHLNPKAVSLSPGIIESMCGEGYLVPTAEEDDDSGGERYYEITEKGKDLSRIKLVKRLPRAKADKLLAEFLDRVTEWNANDPYYWVENVWLYGSMITTADDIGDIDLVCDYRDNPLSPNALTENQQYTLIVYGKYPSDEVEKFIKKRSPYLSFGGFMVSDLNKIRGGYVQIVKDRQVVYQVGTTQRKEPIKVDR